MKTAIESLGLTLDTSRLPMDENWLAAQTPAVERAFAEMEALEAGGIANTDEKRMVGHYWLRAPERAPKPELRDEIATTVKAIKEFTALVRAGGRYTDLLCVGIGGSALGPQLIADALGHPERDAMRVHFLDNTDPDGIERVLSGLRGRLDHTLVIVTSKSGGTPETYNGMRLVEHAYAQTGLTFADHAVAITLPGSKLDEMAAEWRARFPMFDWVGGRTSVTSAVGLLPAALQGLDIDGLLRGAALCDDATRAKDARANAAMMLALAWLKATNGRGEKDMVVLPYKDRLLLFSRYLQQLIMESVGKRLDRTGKVVEQGLAVYGNKGSTDQHAYVQQLREGVNNFFVVFLRVLEEGGTGLEVEPGITAGDYLHGFLLGTRQALSENGRVSLMITVPRVDAVVLGGLIALFERAVGFYASLVGINAYHQPGVEAGKRAATTVLDVQKRVADALTDRPLDPAALAAAAGGDVETVGLLLEHMAANGRARRTASGKYTKG